MQYALLINMLRSFSSVAYCIKQCMLLKRALLNLFTEGLSRYVIHGQGIAPVAFDICFMQTIICAKIGVLANSFAHVIFVQQKRCCDLLAIFGDIFSCRFYDYFLAVSISSQINPGKVRSAQKPLRIYAQLF